MLMLLSDSGDGESFPLRRENRGAKPLERPAQRLVGYRRHPPLEGLVLVGPQRAAAWLGLLVWHPILVEDQSRPRAIPGATRRRSVPSRRPPRGKLNFSGLVAAAKRSPTISAQCCANCASPRPRLPSALAATRGRIVPTV